MLAERLERVHARIAAACARSGRSTNAVTLMAVSKQHPASVIAEAAALGITLFGENRVQEFAQKREELSALPGDMRVEMIGQLQSNKARQAVEIFDGLHSLDSLRLARRLDQAAAQAGKKFPVWLEIKLSLEQTKSGLLPDSGELTELLQELPALNALQPQGLMTVPEWSEDPEVPRPSFRRLRELREQLARQFPSVPLAGLSMGMSHDFETAIEEGSTLVRVGTDLFGPRKPKV